MKKLTKFVMKCHPNLSEKEREKNGILLLLESELEKIPQSKFKNLLKKINQSTAAEIIQIEPQPINSQPELFNDVEADLEIEQIDFDFIQHITPNNVPNSEILSIEEEIVNSIDSVLIPSPDLSNISSPESNSFNFESLSDTNEFPISNENELFDLLLLPIDEDYHINTFEGLGISDSTEFFPTLSESKEISFSPEMLDMFAYNTTD
jgi:hypothetical protein